MDVLYVMMEYMESFFLYLPPLIRLDDQGDYATVHILHVPAFGSFLSCDIFVKKWAKYSHGLTSHLQNKNNNLKEKEKIDKRNNLNESAKDIQSENNTEDIRTYPGTCTDNRTYNNKKKSKRTYDLSKITGYVRGNADITIGSGKIQNKQDKKVSWV